MHRKVPAWFGPGVAGKGPASGGHLASGLPVFCDPAFLVVRVGTVAAQEQGARTAGIDKATVAIVDRAGVEEFLGEIAGSLKAREFPAAGSAGGVIPKGSGKFRNLGIPSVDDRVVQACLKLVLEPIFEADFKPCRTVSARTAGAGRDR